MFRAFFIGGLLGIILSGFMQMFVGVFIEEQQSKELLDKLGFSSVTIQSKASFLVMFRGCGLDDIVRYKVDAYSPTGRHVTLTTCEGIFNHASLRN